MAQLHRLHFIAGQRCYIQLLDLNDMKKTVRSTLLALMHKTVVFCRRHTSTRGMQSLDLTLTHARWTGQAMMKNCNPIEGKGVKTAIRVSK
jgi:hypothetical protein